MTAELAAPEPVIRVNLEDSISSSIEVQIAASSVQLPQASQLQLWAQQALSVAHEGGWSEVPAKAASLCIRLVDEAEGLALNQTYRNKPQPTNVLSFAVDQELAGVDLGPVKPVGDIVLCTPVVEREALEQGKQIPAHYAHLVVHGVLHLLGFDHEEAVAAQDMECKEVAILRQLGIANPYE